MRTTIDVDPRLLEDVVKATGQKTKSKAVNEAIREYLRRKAINELRAMAGKMQIDDLREEQRAADRRREDFIDRLRSK